MQKLKTSPFNASAVIPIKLLTPVIVAARSGKETTKRPITNRPFNPHSAGIAALAILCAVLMGCSLMKPSLPPQGAMTNALDKVIKKDSPEATYSITSADVHSTHKLIIVKISFEDLKIKGKDGKESDLSSGKATAYFDYKDGKWIFSSFQTSEPEIVLLYPNLLVE